MADENNLRRISGVEKAAIFLLTLGEDTASRVLRHIGPKEVHKISSAMASMKNVSMVMPQLTPQVSPSLSALPLLSILNWSRGFLK